MEDNYYARSEPIHTPPTDSLPLQYTKVAVKGFFEGLTVLLGGTASLAGTATKVIVNGFTKGFNK